jgi:eukaryotic-like serine/threonine-protein kinase
MAAPIRTRRRGSLLPVTVRGRNRLRAALILGGAGVAGYLVTCFAYPAPLVTREHQVVRVLGLPLATAVKELQADGFRPRVEDPEPDPVIPAGNIVWQDPPPETAFPRGGTVHLTPSAGPASVPVPDVASFELDQARQVVEAAGLKVGDVDTLSSSAPAGVVIATRPPIATSHPPGTAIELVVSRGPADIRVPDVVGLRQEDARQRLEAAGLRVGIVTTRAGGSRQVGIVVEQRPAGGVLSPREARINLVVGN